MLIPPEDPLEEARLVPAPPRLEAPRLAVPLKLDPLGVAGPTRHQAKGTRWRGIGRGWAVPADARVDHPAQRVVEVAARLGPGEAVTGWASLRLARARYVDGTTTGQRPLPVRILVRSDRRDSGGVVSSRSGLDPGEIVLRDGVPCTNVHRALLDEVCALAETPGIDALREAVVLIDMVLFAELTSLARFTDYVVHCPRRRGLRLVRAALALAVEGSESPRETLMRLVWVLDAQLPAPLSNRAIRAIDGEFLARPDLLCPDLGVAGEYDGLHHQVTKRWSKDIGREGALRNHGLECFSFVAGELGNRPRAAARMREAVQRAARFSQPQTWTFIPTSWSLDDRLALREQMVGLTRGRDALGVLRADTPSRPVGR